FDGETLADEKGGSGASAIVTGLNGYSGTPVYEAGKEGKALRLGDYGLKLNREDLGDNFTVSLWLTGTARWCITRASSSWAIITRRSGWPWAERNTTASPTAASGPTATAIPGPHWAVPTSAGAGTS